MKYNLCSLVCTFLVLSASAAGQTTTATTSQNGAPARLPIPDIPGKTFDLAWVGKIVRVADPQISPNGKSLVTVVTKPDYERDLNLSELALVDIASGKTRGQAQPDFRAGNGRRRCAPGDREPDVGSAIRVETGWIGIRLRSPG
jgi:hypothetical protein